MQPIAAWLVARPMHAVLGLALTLVLPSPQILSGAAMVTLVLYGGARLAALQGLIAVAVLAVLLLVSGELLPETFINVLSVWLPVFLLAWLLRQSCSLILTLQVSVIVAMLVTLGFYVVIGSPTNYWTEFLTETGVLTNMATTLGAMGLGEQAELIVAQKEFLASWMTALIIFTTWSMTALATVLGYAVYQALPGRMGEFGRFCDLRFGRILALVMAVTFMLALLIGAEWLWNLLFVVIAIFWLQGLSMLHWLHVVGSMPFFVLVVVYAMLLLLNALLVLPLAVIGYTDAWFDYRARIGKNMAR